MSAKKSLGFLAAASGLFLSANAFAAETKVETKINNEVEFGLEYQFQLLNTDDGLKAEGKEVKETEFLTRAAKLAIRGKITDQLSWNVLYQADNGKLERYWLTNKVSDSLEVHIGQQKIKTFGFHRRLTSSSASPIRNSMTTSINPLTDKLAVDIVYKMFGTWSLAFVKDYYDASTTCNATATSVCNSWNGYDVQKQPAIAFEWLGSFGDFQPLLQYSRYDRNHSSSLSAGLRYKNDMADAYVDYTMDERNAKGADASGKAEDQKTTNTGIVVYGEFFTGSWTPYAMYSTVEVDQYAAPGAKEKKVNSEGKLDDNEQIITAGVFYEGYGKMYRPYVGVVSTSGKFADPKVTTDEETRTKLDLMVGLTGKF